MKKFRLLALVALLPGIALTVWALISNWGTDMMQYGLLMSSWLASPFYLSALSLYFFPWEKWARMWCAPYFFATGIAMQLTVTAYAMLSSMAQMDPASSMVVAALAPLLYYAALALLGITVGGLVLRDRYRKRSTDSCT